MTIIQKIKEELAQQKQYTYGEYNREHITALVEYYKAAEAEFKYVGTSGDTETYRRLQKARAELEREVP